MGSGSEDACSLTTRGYFCGCKGGSIQSVPKVTPLTRIEGLRYCILTVVLPLIY